MRPERRPIFWPASAPFLYDNPDGKLFGRGTCDKKGFLAIATAFLVRMSKQTLPIPLHIAMSYDEEVGCLGVHDLIDDIFVRIARPCLCIVGEAARHVHRLCPQGQSWPPCQSPRIERTWQPVPSRRECCRSCR
ncbi:M20/M25/M40 family metallo-hydrolase [Agrobacterium sp. rho-8.1]